MFSAWTQLAIRIIYELVKEKDTAARITIPELKRRMGVSQGMREIGQVVHTLSAAGLIGYEWKGSRPKHFYTDDTGRATLYDLMMAVDRRIGFGVEHIGGKTFRPWPLPAGTARAEAMVRGAVKALLKQIPLSSLYPAAGAKSDPRATICKTIYSFT